MALTVRRGVVAVGAAGILTVSLALGNALGGNTSHPSGSRGCNSTPTIANCPTTSTGGTTTSTVAPSTTTTTTPPGGSAPANPAATGAKICGKHGQLDNPNGPPTFNPTHVDVPAGENHSIPPFSATAANTTYYFEPGVHTNGTSVFNQIIPKNGDVFIGAAPTGNDVTGAIIDGQNANLYAFTGQATGVTIEYLTVQNFGNSDWDTPLGSQGNEGGSGVVNHDSGVNWTVTRNTIAHNAGAGLFIGSGQTVDHNCLDHNGEYGYSSFTKCAEITRENPGDQHVTTYCFSIPPGPINIVVDHNEISNNDTFDFEAHIPGCGCTGGGKFWASTDVDVTNNWVHDNSGGAGLWADNDNNGFNFSHNYIADNDGVGIQYEISYNASIVANTFIRNGAVRGPQTHGFPLGAIYISESGGEPRLSNDHGYATIDISSDVFIDNWDGVVEWENASRYCGTHGNPDSGYCAEGDLTITEGADPHNINCNDATFVQTTGILECRWRTQNVSVHDDVFALTQAHVASCTHAVDCGFNAVFSADANNGYQPYASTGCHDLIEDLIIGSAQGSTGLCSGVGSTQHNTFTNNSYCAGYAFGTQACTSGGYWRFMPHEQGQSVTFSAWQAVDTTAGAGSTRHPAMDAGSQCTSCS